MVLGPFAGLLDLLQLGLHFLEHLDDLVVLALVLVLAALVLVIARVLAMLAEKALAALAEALEAHCWNGQAGAGKYKLVLVLSTCAKDGCKRWYAKDGCEATVPVTQTKQVQNLVPDPDWRPSNPDRGPSSLHAGRPVSAARGHVELQRTA